MSNDATYRFKFLKSGIILHALPQKDLRYFDVFPIIEVGVKLLQWVAFASFVLWAGHKLQNSFLLHLGSLLINAVQFAASGKLTFWLLGRVEIDKNKRASGLVGFGVIFVLAIILGGIFNSVAINTENLIENYYEKANPSQSCPSLDKDPGALGLSR